MPQEKLFEKNTNDNSLKPIVAILLNMKKTER